MLWSFKHLDGREGRGETARAAVIDAIGKDEWNKVDREHQGMNCSTLSNPGIVTLKDSGKVVGKMWHIELVN